MFAAVISKNKRTFLMGLRGRLSTSDILDAVATKQIKVSYEILEVSVAVLVFSPNFICLPLLYT